MPVTTYPHADRQNWFSGKVTQKAPTCVMSNYNPEDIKLASTMACSDAKMTAHCSECCEILSKGVMLFIFYNIKGPSVTKRLKTPVIVNG